MFNRIAYDLQLFIRLGLESTKFQSSWRLAWIPIIKGGEDSQAYVMFVHCSFFDMLNHGPFSAMLGSQRVNGSYLRPHEISQDHPHCLVETHVSWFI